MCNPIVFLVWLLCSHVPTMKVSVNVALSLDGFIADKNGGIDWLNNQPNPKNEDFGFNNFLATVDVIVMGHNTFKTVVSFGEEAYPYGDRKLIVWTRKEKECSIPEHLTDRVSASSLGATALLESLGKQGYTHAYIDGGRTIQSFLDAKCIKFLELTRIPILLGEGIALFGQSGVSHLRHIRTTSYENGFVNSKYEIL